MLEINGISYSYDHRKLALNNVTTSFDFGITGLIGKNGSGKSTLFKLLTTILNSQTGEVIWQNSNIYMNSKKYLSQIGYVPQDVPTFDDLTVFEYLNYFAAYKGIDYRKSKKRIEELISYFNLETYKDTRTNKLSGGTLKRLAICNSLLGDPKIWILDEPMNGLDISERNNFKQLLANYGENKLTIISSHILNDIEELAQKSVMINEGKVMISGVTNELIKNLHGKVWSSYIEDLTNINNYNLTALRITPFEGRFIIRYVSEMQFFENAILEQPNLEDVYLCSTHFEGGHNAKNNLL